MKFSATSLILSAALVSFAGLTTTAHAAVDADAAQAMFKKNGCNKCHDPVKNKKGPSLSKIAAKYKGKADGEASITKNITTGPKVKFDDGSEDEHKIIDTKDPKELKNIADWILSN